MQEVWCDRVKMETRYRGTRRPTVEKVTSRRFEGVNFVPNETVAEKEYQYQDLKRLKNANSYISGVPMLALLTDHTEQDDTIMKIFQPISDDLEQDCAPLTPSLSVENEGMFDKTDLAPKLLQVTDQFDWNQKDLHVPGLSLLGTNQSMDKISLVPDLPPLEEERDWLETFKKSEFQTPGQPDYRQGPPDLNSYTSLQPESEDSFVSVQTKKGFSRGSRVLSVPKEDLNYNFVQHELRQSQQVNFFIPNTVQYTTKSALNQFVQKLPDLPSGTHGCIVEEGYNPDCQQYMENIHFVSERRLGSGSFGIVDLVVDSTSNKKLVRKQVEKSQMQAGEIIIPLNLNSVHVSKIIGLIQRQTNDGVKMELLLEYAGTGLNNYLIQDGNILTPDQIWQLTKQALEGLAHIHKYGMIHLDVKPENLCIQDANDSLQLKITDFGSAKLPYEDINFTGWTPEYMAPESCQYFLQMMHNLPFGLEQGDITGKVDVFALFLVIGYMYGKKHVLLSLVTQGRGNYHRLTVQEKKDHQTRLIVMLASSNGENVDALINDSCDLDMRELLKKMSCPKETRLTAREALDIVERRKQIQQQVQRDKEIKLQMHQQQQERREKLAEFHYQVPDLDKIGLPATVMTELNCERSLIKDRLREKLLPYKKMSRSEVPKTPMTPVEEMKMLQIRTGKSRGKGVEEQGQYKLPFEMIREEPSIPMTVETGRTSYVTTRHSIERTRPLPVVTTPVDTRRMPIPAVLGAQLSIPGAKRDYENFIDLKTQKQDCAELQGNIPNVLFDI